MKMLELHIIQSFPVTCLNRDDVGAPKSARFGGVQRARVSSQCWKRAIRELATSLAPNAFAGQRTRYVVRELQKAFAERGCEEPKARLLAELTADALGKLDDPVQGNVKTLLFYSPQELQAIVTEVLAMDLDESLLVGMRSDDKKVVEKAQKALAKPFAKAAKALSSAVKDAADIAIFGRMVADDHTLTVEGAGLFSHALSTHSVSNELDFFSAVDDTKIDATDAGAGHIGTIEFNSACYYRYIGLNLDLLWDAQHLGNFDPEERKQVVEAFLRAAILAVPNARKNSMFGFNPPTYVLGLQRSGQPLSLVNAFESAVPGGTGGYVQTSVDALKQQWRHLQDLYCLKAVAEAELPPDNLDAFVGKLTGGAA